MAFDQFHDSHVCPSCATLLARAEAAERRVRELVGALRLVEWDGVAFMREWEIERGCSLCECTREQGHAADCALGRALAGAAEQEGG